MAAALPCDGTSRRVLAPYDEWSGRQTDERIASRWLRGICPSLIQHWRGGGRSMPVWALAAMLRRVPLGVGAAMTRELLPEGLDVVILDHLPTGELMPSVVSVSTAAARLLDAAFAALQDGRLTTLERAELLALLDRIEAQLQQCRRALAGGSR